MVAHAFNPRIWEAEAGGFLNSVRGKPHLQSEFQDSQSYTEKPCLKQNKTKQNKNNNNKKDWMNPVGGEGFQEQANESKRLPFPL